MVRVIWGIQGGSKKQKTNHGLSLSGRGKNQKVTWYLQFDESAGKQTNILFLSFRGHGGHMAWGTGYLWRKGRPLKKLEKLWRRRVKGDWYSFVIAVLPNMSDLRRVIFKGCISCKQNARISKKRLFDMPHQSFVEAYCCIQWWRNWLGGSHVEPKFLKV